MEILTNISTETLAVVVSTLVGAIIAPFARRLGNAIYARFKNKGS